MHVLGGHRVIPVLSWDKPETAELIASSLIAGELPVVEVTFRSPRAAELLRALAKVPELVVGAGTVINTQQVTQAAECGARFLVSPGVSREVIAAAKAVDLPIFPGIATPTDIMAARDEGLTVLKFFPAELLGGLPLLKAYSQVFPDISFIPTGGINPTNLDAYLSAPGVAAIGGTWLFDRAALASGDSETLVQAIRLGRRRT